MTTSCVFCDIVEKKTPSYTVFESENVICFLPREMEVYGHTIVAPKNHYAGIYDIPDEILSDLMRVTKKLALHYQGRLQSTGINILHASGKGSQQSVFHFHLHLLPRFENDGLDTWPKLQPVDVPPSEMLDRIGVLLEEKQRMATMNDIFQSKLVLLKQEIDNLQTGIYSYDKILFTIKGWAITIFSGFITLTVQQNKPQMLLLAAISVVLFWILDALFKSIQRVYIARYNQIEEYLISSKFADALNKQDFGDFIFPRIGASFQVDPKHKYLALIKALFLLHSVMLYFPMLVVIVLLGWFMGFAG
ncbi:MAG: HIT domain-containing protein [Methanobacteriota archaeon]|nr:MAG: HIT domain-containing protein [Euryarchaeota archaeon]